MEEEEEDCNLNVECDNIECMDGNTIYLPMSFKHEMDMIKSRFSFYFHPQLQPLSKHSKTITILFTISKFNYFIIIKYGLFCIQINCTIN